jgi:TctA family transporter
MDPAYVSAVAALSGSIVGGLTSALTTWVSQRTQARAALIAREISRRDELYKDFIAAASKAYGDAVVSN